MTDTHAVFAPDSFSDAAAGPLYLRLKALIQSAIHDGRLHAYGQLNAGKQRTTVWNLFSWRAVRKLHL